ncbi:hypothetical protein M0813_26733 [Anaeramoeba flamelloides]|uniref:Uncharacterized protein n=1 Tax=Anaeramoeba flamelloides TaxID=1746091 RepID=A0ABQ8Y0G7_9EUKA|nr:hypothetical protein M0813_26733 [Anaeramoeba flamelloides]
MKRYELHAFYKIDENKTTEELLKMIPKECKPTERFLTLNQTDEPEKSRIFYYGALVLHRNANEQDLEGINAKILEMKPTVLDLVTGRNEKTNKLEYLRIIQTSRYLSTNDYEAVKKVMAADVKFLEEHGMIALRTKTELDVLGSPEGYPLTDEQAREMGKYFEFHFKLELLEDSGSNNNKYDNKLYDIGKELQKLYGTIVPFSYNLVEPYQRFLNLRFWDNGYNNIEKFIKLFTKKILEYDCIVSISRTISEYIVQDSLEEFDYPWIGSYDDKVNLKEVLEKFN